MRQALRLRGLCSTTVGFTVLAVNGCYICLVVVSEQGLRHYICYDHDTLILVLVLVIHGLSAHWCPVSTDVRTIVDQSFLFFAAL